jgi:hypothetical protein
MRKSLVLLSFALLSCARISAQIHNNVYSDVLQLRKQIDNTGKLDPSKATVWIPIFKKYVPKQDQAKLTDINSLKAYFSNLNNPFKPDTLMIPDTSRTRILSKASLSDLDQVSTATASTNNFSAPVLAGELTQVIIERAKEELAVAFFDRFKAELQKTKYAALDSLFPKTTNFITNIESYLYAGSLNTLRQAFGDDIANLPARIPFALRSADVRDSLSNNPKYQNVWIMVPAFCFVGRLLNGGTVANAVNDLYPDPELETVNPNIYNILKAVVSLSESVRDNSGKANWIPKTDLDKNIVNDPLSQSLFLGLLYEEIKDVEILDAKGKVLVAFNNIIQPGTISNLETAIVSIVSAYDALSSAVTDVKTALKSKKDSSAVDKVFSLINTALGKCDDAKAAIDALTNINVDPNNSLASIRQFVPPLEDVVNAIYAKQYSAAVMNSVLLINIFTKTDRNTSIQKYLKYASFMAAIAEAKTPADINTALNSAILPVGSSSIKQNTAFSIAINSYIGAGYYTEYYKTTSSQMKMVQLPTFGVSLPVGVSFNFGLRNKVVGSLSLFASVLDLGAIASFKLRTPDSVQSQSLPNFAWQNLLAPGAYLVFGRLLNSPLALGVGVQKGPQLRNITYTPQGGTSEDLSSNETLRFGLFLSVDIPLFNLFSAPYKKPYNSN